MGSGVGWRVEGLREVLGRVWWWVWPLLWVGWRLEEGISFFFGWLVEMGEGMMSISR